MMCGVSFPYPVPNGTDGIFGKRRYFRAKAGHGLLVPSELVAVKNLTAPRPRSRSGSLSPEKEGGTSHDSRRPGAASVLSDDQRKAEDLYKARRMAAPGVVQQGPPPAVIRTRDSRVALCIGNSVADVVTSPKKGGAKAGLVGGAPKRRWTAFLEAEHGWPDPIAEVEFTLLPGGKMLGSVRTARPYEVSRVGWSAPEIGVLMRLRSGRAVQLTHQVVLSDTGAEACYALNLATMEVKRLGDESSDDNMTPPCHSPPEEKSEKKSTATVLSTVNEAGARGVLTTAGLLPAERVEKSRSHSGTSVAAAQKPLLKEAVPLATLLDAADARLVLAMEQVRTEWEGRVAAAERRAEVAEMAALSNQRMSTTQAPSTQSTIMGLTPALALEQPACAHLSLELPSRPLSGPMQGAGEIRGGGCLSTPYPATAGYIIGGHGEIAGPGASGCVIGGPSTGLIACPATAGDIHGPTLLGGPAIW